MIPDTTDPRPATDGRAAKAPEVDTRTVVETAVLDVLRRYGLEPDSVLGAVASDIYHAVAAAAAAYPDRWEYGRYDLDENRVMAFDGTPRVITPKMLRRPLAAFGPWQRAS